MGLQKIQIEQWQEIASYFKLGQKDFFQVMFYYTKGRRNISDSDCIDLIQEVIAEFYLESREERRQHNPSLVKKLRKELLRKIQNKARSVVRSGIRSLVVLTENVEELEQNQLWNYNQQPNPRFDIAGECQHLFNEIEKEVFRLWNVHWKSSIIASALGKTEGYIRNVKSSLKKKILICKKSKDE